MRQARDLIVESMKEDKDLLILHIKSASKAFKSGDWRTGTLMIRDIWEALEPERSQILGRSSIEKP